MRGNHQEESPLMKFAPEVAEAYQVQQYNTGNIEISKEQENNFLSGFPIIEDSKTEL